MSKVKVGDIAIINGKSLGKNIPFSKMQYLDTGSITNGIIENIQMIDCNNDTIPSRAKRMVKNNTIVYSTVRPRLRHYGILHNPQENMIVSIDAIEEKVNPLFLYYSLIKEDVTEYIASIADTAVSSYPSINPSDIADLEIDIPSILEQNKIAEILSSIDDKISNNNRINAELESMAKTIYDYWFTQFDFPDENGKPYRSSGGKMVWNDELKREIPEGWGVGKLNNIIDISNNKVSMDNIGDRVYVPIEVIPRNKMSFYETADIEKAATGLCSFEKKSILLSNRRVYFHKVSISPFDGVTRDTVIIINPKNKENLGYIFQVVNSNHFIEYATRNSYGTEQPVLATPTVQNYLTLLPNENLDLLYSEKVQPLIDKILKLQIENMKLASLRDWLLPMLMNGQVGFEEGT